MTSQWEAALEALRNGECVAVLDGEEREGETDLFFPAASLSPASLRLLRTQAGGEMYMSVGHEVASAFGLPYIGNVLALTEVSAKFPVFQYMEKSKGEMCQGSCSVGVSLDHRTTKTGAPDVERSYTCRRLAELFQEVKEMETSVDASQRRFGEEFHTPGHIFLCVENGKGLSVRTGHTELSIALANAAGVTPVMVGCVMLSNDGDDFGALRPAPARAWAASRNIPFLTGSEIVKHVLG
ncbi:uncharacterized protein [Physcomitrium patens]|uniref:3,4-dihydroxy-2-butanone-4-phosphate synthase n=1 Tax=Physcomitrium patens TaxID=3218 RepID=A9SK36_PHYPA|nr:uncharacterized protein LOC112282095 [Physcomitrium patens]PNR62145.1 hypothetical protein PHYPA_000569 [Physcomitrium patens]|eukprot:XP_024375117.1 uncharacterized protein LOC112282095 [Physcomitrella patens]